MTGSPRSTRKTFLQDRLRGSGKFDLDVSGTGKRRISMPRSRRDRLALAVIVGATVLAVSVAAWSTKTILPRPSAPPPATATSARHRTHGEPALGVPQGSATGLGVHPLPTPATTPGAAATTLLDLTQTASWYDPLVGLRALEVVATPGVAWHVVTAPLLTPQQVAAHESVTAIISCQTIPASITSTTADVDCIVDDSDLWVMRTARSGHRWLVTSAIRRQT